MSDYGKTLVQIRRERVTQESVRSMDAHEIVDWIHSLEDEVVCFEERNRELESDMRQALHAINVGDTDAAKDTLRFALEPPR